VYILDQVKYRLNQEFGFLKKQKQPLDDYDEGYLSALEDIIIFIRAQEACFDEEKFFRKHGFRNPDGETAKERVMTRYIKQKMREE
jgi:hypothetical protein